MRSYKFGYLKDTALVTFAVLLFSFSLASAQTESLEEEKQQAEFAAIQKLETGFKSETYHMFMPSRGVSSMSGKVQVTDTESAYTYDLKAFGKLPVELSFDSEYIGIDNATRVPIPARLTRLAWGVETTLPFFNFNKTYWRTGVFPSFWTGNWSFDSSSFRIPFRSFLIYQPNDKWTYIFGVAVYPEFQNVAVPMIGFIYKPNDKLSFNIVPDRPNITYMLNDKFGVFGEFDTSFDEYEVKRNDSEHVVLRYREKHLGAGVQYQLNKFIQASLSVGGMFGRVLKYADDEGKVAIKNGLYTEFRINIQI